MKRIIQSINLYSFSSINGKWCTQFSFNDCEWMNLMIIFLASAHPSCSLPFPLTCLCSYYWKKEKKYQNEHKLFFSFYFYYIYVFELKVEQDKIFFSKIEALDIDLRKIFFNYSYAYLFKEKNKWMKSFMYHTFTTKIFFYFIKTIFANNWIDVEIFILMSIFW